jgi:CubicO group peptidase (beta-lactamase class C family)
MRAVLAATVLLLITSPAAAEPLSEALELLKSQGFSGQVVAADNERVLFDRTVGMTVTPKRWIWGSVSKQVTAVLIMSEVDQGTLDLDDTIQARLPTFRDPQGGRATVRQLLQHTSGLANPYAGVAEGQTPAFFLSDPRTSAVLPMRLVSAPGRQLPSQAASLTTTATLSSPAPFWNELPSARSQTCLPNASPAL